MGVAFLYVFGRGIYGPEGTTDLAVVAVRLFGFRLRSPRGADQRCLGVYGGEHLVRGAVVAGEAASRRVVDLGVQLWRAGGVARVAHHADRRTRGDRLVGSETL